MNGKMANDLLNKLNKKSKKKWSMEELKSLTQGYSGVDLYDPERTESLIRRVAEAAGVDLSDSKVDKVKKELYNKLGKR